MWITIKDVLVFESVHTPKKQSWTAANRMMQKLGQIGLITVGLGILLGVGAWLTSGAAVFLAGLIIVWAMFAVVGLMASYNDDHRASLARSILAGKRRLYYATPEDFSYQVVQDDKYHLDDTAALENYFMGPHIRKLDASIRDKPDELSAAWVRNQRNAKLNVILMAEDLIDRPGRVAALRATVQSELEDALHEITVRHRELAQGG